jgi:threonylcarbamoyladenosine tRNA methylthiotransferase MtaB
MDKAEPQIVTFGCRLNAYESEVMRTHAQKAGMGDAIIFNTCAVTKEAERQARQAIRRARRENPNAKIIVTGCSAQITPDMYAEMDEVDQIIGNDLKLQEETWNTRHNDRVLVKDIMQVKETAGHLIEGFEDRARAFLQVQNGCDHRCTFCIIPYGRGNSRSVPIGVITQQVRDLVAQGYNEIVFTGVDVTSYGPDLPGKPTLGQMMRRVLALVPELPRLRMSSLDPVEIDEDLWHLIEHEPRLMPHLHLSLQAGDDMILKRMKRRHLRADVIEVCRRARELRPDMAFGADIIAGFPTETDEMFENTRNIIEECDLSYLHIFPYSEREGTPAAKMPPVPMDIRKSRAATLRAEGKKQLQKTLNDNLNKTHRVIVEKGNTGHTENFVPVKLDAEYPSGTLVNFTAHAIDGEHLTGTTDEQA